MSVIEVSDELAAAIKARAASQGLTLDTWLKKLVAEADAPESEQEEQTKLEWLRAAAREGFGAIECGDYVPLNSAEEISAYMRQLHEDVRLELAAERNLA